MQRDPGMAKHLSAWNVHMVETPSVDSGIDDTVMRNNRNTVYNTGYFCKSVRRLICGNQLTMYDVAIEEYPNFDQIVLLVNDSRYGGGGGNVAIASSASPLIALHEMGHSFAKLADEYVDRYIPETSLPSYSEGLFANVSTFNDPAKVPWRHWLNTTDVVPSVDIPDVGIIEGAFYRPIGFYRPTADSLMRSYDGLLGPVNAEQWALSVYGKVSPVQDISPTARVIRANAFEPTTFWVEPLFASTIQSVEWRLDNELIAHSGGEKPMVSLDLPAGTYELELTVRDISGLIRKPEPHGGVFKREWAIVIQ